MDGQLLAVLVLNEERSYNLENMFHRRPALHRLCDTNVIVQHVVRLFAMMEGEDSNFVPIQSGSHFSPFPSSTAVITIKFLSHVEWLIKVWKYRVMGEAL